MEFISQLTTFNKVKKENKDLLKKDIKANQTIINLESQIVILSNSLQYRKRHFSEKLPNLKLFHNEKQKLQSWTYTLKVKLVGNANCYLLELSKI